MSDDVELLQVIERVRRMMPKNRDVMEICHAAEDSVIKKPEANMDCAGCGQPLGSGRFHICEKCFHSPKEINKIQKASESREYPSHDRKAPKEKPMTEKEPEANGRRRPSRIGAPLIDGFDKSAYQKLYMRDARWAKKRGLTVKEYRALPGYTESDGAPAPVVRAGVPKQAIKSKPKGKRR
jgi:hypothetical protein